MAYWIKCDIKFFSRNFNQKQGNPLKGGKNHMPEFISELKKKILTQSMIILEKLAT